MAFFAWDNKSELLQLRTKNLSQRSPFPLKIKTKPKQVKKQNNVLLQALGK
jgi:hypothetical protein